MQVGGMWSGAEGQPLGGTTTDSVCVAGMSAHKLTLGVTLRTEGTESSHLSYTSTVMEMEQLFRGELGEGAQTLHDSSAAAAQRLRYIMQKPPMLSS